MKKFTTKRNGKFPGFAVLCIAAIFSLALLGCKTDSDDDSGGGGGVTAPEELKGVWINQWTATSFLYIKFDGSEMVLSTGKVNGGQNVFDDDPSDRLTITAVKNGSITIINDRSKTDYTFDYSLSSDGNTLTITSTDGMWRTWDGSYTKQK